MRLMQRTAAVSARLARAKPASTQVTPNCFARPSECLFHCYARVVPFLRHSLPHPPTLLLIALPFVVDTTQNVTQAESKRAREDLRQRVQLALTVDAELETGDSVGMIDAFESWLDSLQGDDLPADQRNALCQLVRCPTIVYLFVYISISVTGDV